MHTRKHAQASGTRQNTPVNRYTVTTTNLQAMALGVVLVGPVHHLLLDVLVETGIHIFAPPHVQLYAEARRWSAWGCVQGCKLLYPHTKDNLIENGLFKGRPLL